MCICAHFTTPVYLSKCLSRKRSAYARKPSTRTLLPHLPSLKRFLMNLWKVLHHSQNSTLITQFKNDQKGVAMISPLGPALANIFLAILSANCFLGFKNRQSIFDVLTTPLPSLNRRETLTISWSRLLVFVVLSSSRLRRNTIENFGFETFLRKELNLVLKPVYTEIPLFLVNTSD